MRQIDADALMQTYAKFVAPSNNSDFENEPTWNDAVSLLEFAPTVDAVEVVRCKDCTYCNNGWCYDFGIHMNDNEFCSGGERKDKTDLKEIK